MGSKRDSDVTVRGPLAVLAVAAGCAGSPDANASTPTLTWAGAERIGVQCVVGSTLPGAQALQKDFCERVRAMAAARAPVPVRAIPAGDPALMNPTTVTLLVHASLRDAGAVAPGAPGKLLAFTIRPFRPSPDNAVLFGTAPQIVQLDAADTGARGAEAAVSAALSELLPWRAAAPGPRTLSN